MTRTTRSSALAALLAGLAACGACDAPESGPMTAVEKPGTAAPETKTAPVVVAPRDTATAAAGDTVELAFKRFDAPADFPLQFATYVPEDMIVETAMVGANRPAFRVVANFGGKRDVNAYLWVLFHPPGTSEARAREAYLEVVSKRDAVEEVPERARRFAWALAEHRFRYQVAGGRTHLGMLALGRRGERYFHVVIEYPEAMAAGFLARVDRILEDWRWKEDGSRRIGDRRSSR